MTEDFRGFECIAVVGVGLIGGSLALALRRRGLVRRVVGVGRSRENLEVAQSLGILDAFSQDLAEGVWEADLVVVATPVGAIGPTVAAMREHLAPGTIVTDVGSVKGSVVRECEAALEGVGTFVGGHPIAGTERSGAGAAFAELFDGRLTVLTPTDRTAPEALAAVRALWEAAGARVALMDPDLHDRILAGVSHLPHMVAYALMDAVGAMEREDASDYLGFSAGGLRDFTRVAGSDPVMWRDIALANRAALLRALDANAGSLARLRHLVEQGDGPGLEALFAEARDRREALKRLEENKS